MVITKIILLFLFCLFSANMTLANNSQSLNDKLVSPPTENDECDIYIQDILNQDLTPIQTREELFKPYLDRALIWENDAFDLIEEQNRDYHYTNGIKFTWTHNPCRYEMGKWTRKIKNLFSQNMRYSSDYLDENAIQTMTQTGRMFGMNMYTPKNAKCKGEVPCLALQQQVNDRPYSGYLYFGRSFQTTHTKIMSANNSNKQVLRDIKIHNLDLQYGVIGPLAGQGYIQNYTHDPDTYDTGRPVVGWENQTKNKLALNAIYETRRNYFFENIYSRLTLNYGLSIGNVKRYINSGATLSVGRFMNSYPSSTLKPALITPMLSQKGQQALFNNENETIEFLETNKKPFYFYTGFDLKHIFYDASLEDELINGDPHTISLINFVYDIFFGFAISGEHYTFNLRQMYRSREFSSPEPSFESSNYFGHISLEYKY